MRRSYVIQGIFWVLIYILLISAPVLILFTGELPPGRELWRELSVALGFLGLAMMMLQFVLTARFKTIKAPYGADIVYHFHRQISFIALAFILLHPLLLFIFSPATLALLNIFTAPWRAKASVSAVILLILLIAASVWRKLWKIEYTRWRIWHGVLAIIVVALATTHIILARHYLNTPMKQVLWISYGVFWIWLLVYVRLVKPLMLMRTPYEVVSVTAERNNAWSLKVQPLGHKVFNFMPGQFAWITARSNPFEESEHPFSISSSAARPETLTFTIKELGDFTSKIKELKPGEKVFVDGPYGHFSANRHQHAEHLVFIAGGVGITPFMSMLRTMAERGEKRPLTLLYANKDWENIIFREEIEALQKMINLKVVHVLEKPPEDWSGETGFVTRAVLERHLPKVEQRNVVEIFICGPLPMLNAVERALSDIGIPYGDYHSERFDLV